MKILRTRIIICAIGLLCVLEVRSLLADGTEVLGPPGITIQSGTGIIVAGTGLGGFTHGVTQPQPINFTVPPGATVKQVLLYWEGDNIGSFSADNTLTVNGNGVTGTLIGGPTLFFHDPSINEDVTFATFRADITSLNLVSAGANSLSVGGMANTYANNGAGVLVIIDDGFGPANIDLRDGQDLAFWNFAPPLDAMVPQTFTFAASTSARTATLSMFFASAEGAANQILITVNGSTTTLNGLLNNNSGPDWDTIVLPVTIPAGATSVTVEPVSPAPDGASVTWITGALSVPPPREQQVTCRVTGGGVLLPGTVDQSCIEVETTIIPLTTPNGLTINKITHGGQLGAPFSHMDCGEILGNPCIRGQWSHTRHYQGKGNPRDVIDMKFHSNTPKGVFDSLNCACLGCCDPGTGAFITPIVVGQLCNPDNRVCGPEPRPAPANAIIFSGIGTITPEDDTRGPQADRSEWVVFRIYIEDRSEPGGVHPGGAVEPADIYCLQAWKTGIKVSKKADFSTVLPEFRRALGQANCAFLADLQSGAKQIGSLPSPVVSGVTADIQDCGPMNTGNHQIHPSTGATCQ